MDQIHLKPCPFCGSEDCEVTDVDEILKTNWVICNQCGTFGPDGSTEAEAIEKWNQRI